VPHFEAPTKLAYSAKNRSASIRIPSVNSSKARRIEARFPDPTANPYLAFAALLMAGLDGIQNKIHPGDPAGKNLDEFWGDKITDLLNQTLKQADSDVLINLASQEYFKSVNTKKLNARLITPIFKDEKNGKYKIISFYAKRARGLMVRYAAEHGITEPEMLKNFDYEGYSFNEAASNEAEWIFMREEQSK